MFIVTDIKNTLITTTVLSLSTNLIMTSFELVIQIYEDINRILTHLIAKKRQEILLLSENLAPQNSNRPFPAWKALEEDGKG